MSEVDIKCHFMCYFLKFVNFRKMIQTNLRILYEVWKVGHEEISSQKILLNFISS